MSVDFLGFTKVKGKAAQLGFPMLISSDPRIQVAGMGKAKRSEFRVSGESLTFP